MALTDKLTAIANAIRVKTGKTGTLTLEQMVSEVSNISTGLADSELAATTASTADVLSGKTFYSGDKTVKTGTIPTKGATTYGAKTSTQTIAAGQYLSGAQTIAAVTQSNLSAVNILKGNTVTIASNGSNLWSVTGTLVGGISLRGAGTKSSTYSLPAGTYKFEYMSCCFSTSGSSPDCYLYVGNLLKYTGNSVIINTAYNGVDYSVKSGSTTITLTTTSNVYLSTSAGNFNPYAFCTLYRTS